MPNPVHGLILMGGQSTRFGSPKGVLLMEGEMQWHRMYDLLLPLCETVSFSLNASTIVHYPNIEPSQTILDNTKIQGPMAGLLAAFNTHPDRTWMLVSVDLLFLNSRVIELLLRHRNSLTTNNETTSKETSGNASNHLVTAIYHQTIQPLCAIYEPTCLEVLKQQVTKQQYSLYKTIRAIPHTLLSIEHTGNRPHPLTNINTKEELEHYLSYDYAH